MSEDLLDYDKELTQLLNEIEQWISEIPKIKAKDKDDHIDYIKKRIMRSKDVLTSFKYEIRMLDKIQSEPYNKKAKEYSLAIIKLKNDLCYHEERIDLLKNKGENDTGLDGKTTDDVLQHAQNTQVHSSNILDKIITEVEHIREVGANIGHKLNDNTESLNRIESGVSEVDDNLKSAATALKSFSRRIVTDKLFLCFICLLVCGIIVIIVWSIVDKNANTNVPESFKPKITTSKITPTTHKQK